jgi:hypothetical protein
MAVCAQSVVCLGNAAPSPQRGPVGDRFAHSRGTGSLLAVLWFGFFRLLAVGSRANLAYGARRLLVWLLDRGVRIDARGCDPKLEIGALEIPS